jgi:hypothetical protein
MKNIFTIAAAVVLAFSSCTDYLDKPADSDITDSQVFGSYKSFQGYLDVLYGNGLIAVHSQAFTATFDMGDDVDNTAEFTSSYIVPRGDYRWALGDQYRNQNPFITTTAAADSPHIGLWDQAWINIRTCNLGLRNMGLLTNYTQDQYDCLKGQMLFFRAWNHIEIAKYWGGLPYIETAFGPADDMKLPRLSFKQTMLKVAEDLAQAAPLLPEEWEDPAVNRGRVTRGAAHALRSRALLYAASPLASKAADEGTQYDIELCKQAAEAAYEVIKLADRGIYKLSSWDDYQYQFCDSRPVSLSPRVVYTDETIFSKIKNAYGSADQGAGGQIANAMGRIFNSLRFGGNGVVCSPTGNFVDLYETATGYAVADAPSGDHNELVPWAGRDPRLMKTILTDGVKWVERNSNANAYIQLYTNVGGSTEIGLDRKNGDRQQSKTGYLVRKYIPYRVNSIDAGTDWQNYRFNCPYIRLAEIYLNYAEAVNEAYGPKSVPTDFEAGGLTAVEAVNILRRRVKLPVNEDLAKPAELQNYGNESLPDVRDIYTGSREAFRDRVYNERSVELAFEGHRFTDMRRWLRTQTVSYQRRYAHDFNKEHTWLQKSTLFETPFEEKHFWFPFRSTDVEQYVAFEQNPGW